MKCKFTKELLSGKNIDLREFNLGIIKQPKVQTFIEVVDSIEFIKPFYMVRYWNNNGAFEEVEMPFNIYYTLSQKNKSLLVDLILYLMILYDTKDIKLKNCGDKGYSIFIKSQDNIESFIDDSNFNILSKIVLEIMYYDEPKKEIKQKIEGSAEDIALFEKYEKEYKEKQMKKNAIYFEEIVRQVIHTRKTTYEEIKNWTAWQLQDTYKSMKAMEDCELAWKLAIAGAYKGKEIPPWYMGTRLMRDE